MPSRKQKSVGRIVAGAIALALVAAQAWAEEAAGPPPGAKIEKKLPEREDTLDVHAVPQPAPELGGQGRLDMGASSQMGAGVRIRFGRSNKKRRPEPRPTQSAEPGEAPAEGQAKP